MILDSISAKVVDAVGNKIAEILKLNTAEKQAVTVKLEPDSFTLTELDHVSTISKEYSDLLEPDLEFENPLKRDVIVTEFSILPDSNFKTHGTVKIYANDVILFKSKQAGNFENVNASVVKILQGKTIKPDSSVKVFIKNDDGTTPVKLTVQLTYGEK